MSRVCLHFSLNPLSTMSSTTQPWAFVWPWNITRSRHHLNTSTFKQSTITILPLTAWAHRFTANSSIISCGCVWPIVNNAKHCIAVSFCMALEYHPWLSSPHHNHFQAIYYHSPTSWHMGASMECPETQICYYFSCRKLNYQSFSLLLLNFLTPKYRFLSSCSQFNTGTNL